MGMMASDGPNLLARLRPTGRPTLAIPPSRTASTKLGWVGVPSTLLKTEMQPGPHCGVAALAVPETAALTPATHVSVATAVSTFLLIDTRWVDDELTTESPFRTRRRVRDGTEGGQGDVPGPWHTPA